MVSCVLVLAVVRFSKVFRFSFDFVCWLSLFVVGVCVPASVRSCGCCCLASWCPPVGGSGGFPRPPGGGLTAD